MKSILMIFVGGSVVALGNMVEAWYVTILVGAIFAVIVPTGGRAAGVSLLTGILGWGVPLLWVAPLAHVVKLAGILGGILGLGGAVATVVGLLLPSLTGALLAVCSSWIIVAVRGAFVTGAATKPIQHVKPQTV